MKPVKIFIAVLMVFALFVACWDSPTDDEEKDKQTTDPEKAERVVASADSVVEEMINESESGSDIMEYIEGAADLYKEAAIADPDNSHANFGAALFNFQKIVDHRDVAMIRDTLEDWDSESDDLDHARYYVTRVFMHNESSFFIPEDDGWGWEEQIDPEEAFFALMYFVQNSLSSQDIITLLQDSIDNTLIASLDESIAFMDNVHDDPAFTFILSSDMTGDDQDYEIDLGEAYMISAAMHVMRASLKIMNAYQLSIPGATSISDYTDETKVLPLLKAQDEGDGAFLKLRSTKMLPAAKQDLIDALTNIELGSAFIKSETDDQSNDIIKREDLTEGEQDMREDFSGEDMPIVPLKDASGITDLVSRIKTMLDGPFDVIIDEEDDSETLSINLSAFFNNNIPDLKDLLPYRRWKNVNDFEKGFGGPGIDTWGEETLDGVTYREMYLALPWNYEEAVDGDGLVQLYDYLGTISPEGVVTINKMHTWDSGYVDTYDGFGLTTDGAIYLNAQKQVCITEAAYNALNTYVANAPRESWVAIDQLYMASDLATINYSVDHPYGVRSSNGVFNFAGSPEYTGSYEPIILLDGPNGNQLGEDEPPVFPDPTFGGLFPGMTRERIESLFE